MIKVLEDNFCQKHFLKGFKNMLKFRILLKSKKKNKKENKLVILE